MKKILVLLLILLLIFMPFAASANDDSGGSNGGESGNGLDDSPDDDSGRDGERTEIRNETESEDDDELEIESDDEDETEIEREHGGNVTKIKIKIDERKRELEQETEQLRIEEREIVQNQNSVRMGAEAFIIADDETGGLGENVSQIAREFNNSVEVTIQAEERIRSRSGVVRVFIGGDEVAAREIEREVIQNENRIRELEQIIQQCACDEEIKLLLQEQLQMMEQEQERLRNLADDELEDKGIVGWIWK
jgi:predicted ribosome quality control (RQC) complex YloA/Tae2 family protein